MAGLSAKKCIRCSVSSGFCDRGHLHTRMDWSPDFLSTSSCSRRKALLPSPYRIGMFMPKMPISEYAVSSGLAVSLCAIQPILVATFSRCSSVVILRSFFGSGCNRNDSSIPVISLIVAASECRSPRGDQSLSTNSTSSGASSSWSVQPRVNQRLCLRAATAPEG